MRKSPINQTVLAWAGVLAIALGAVILLGPTAQAGTLRRAEPTKPVQAVPILARS